MKVKDIDAAKRAEYKRRYYDAKQHGFCVVCGAKTDGYTHCKKCRAIARERLAERKRMEV